MDLVLQVYNLCKVVQLKTDASNLVIKVYLIQKKNNKRHLIVYYF